MCLLAGRCGWIPCSRCGRSKVLFPGDGNAVGFGNVLIYRDVTMARYLLERVLCNSMFPGSRSKSRFFLARVCWPVSGSADGVRHGVASRSQVLAHLCCVVA